MVQTGNGVRTECPRQEVRSGDTAQPRQAHRTDVSARGTARALGPGHRVHTAGPQVKQQSTHHSEHGVSPGLTPVSGTARNPDVHVSTDPAGGMADSRGAVTSRSLRPQQHPGPSSPSSETSGTYPDPRGCTPPGGRPAQSHTQQHQGESNSGSTSQACAQSPEARSSGPTPRS